jgi:hypothetical protein
MTESCPACDARRVIIAAIDAPAEELREMDGRIELGPTEAVVQFSVLTLRQFLEPVPRIVAEWFGDLAMGMTAPDRLAFVDGPWIEVLANIRAELEARFGTVELGGTDAGHLH